MRHSELSASLVSNGAFSAEEFIDIVETIYRGARKGRGLVMSPKDQTMKTNHHRHTMESKCGLPEMKDGFG